tara:strand:- start:837 stop:1292 length:456 start_codon:yes stop_codon:yes gene_type:complete
MTKIREPLSIEKILKDLIGKLKENEIKEFTGKSISHFRKCSDPDDKDHNLHLADAIKFDILSLRSQNGSPFLDNIELIIDQEFNELEKLKDVSRILNNIGGRIGNLMDVTEQATSPESQKGAEISSKEKDNIFKAISEVEEKIAKLKLSVK